MHPLKPSLRIPYKHVDSTPIPTDVYLPTPSSSQPSACPVLLMIHGGGFMVGHAGVNNKDQIQDCLDRGWIVLALEHRLCPGVNVLEGPMTDVRDALAWVYNGGLSKALESENWKYSVDQERVVVMGTSSGGHLALSTAFHTPRAPLAILDFYGAKHYTHPFWTSPLPSMPPHFSNPIPPSDIALLKSEKTTLIGGVSLEGQAPPSTPDPNAQTRQAFTMHAIATGTMISTVWPAYPSRLEEIDPMMNVSSTWPPVGIVHGVEDVMVPMAISKAFAEKLKEKGGEVEFFEVEGEGHTFCGKMVKGSKTWESQRRGFDWLEGVVKRSYN
ncbi:hypothetical protein NX059_008613 [Plenodomus lindquistii]|nr:hypothetical protein NX059_008613 [Plenodomus lindquistii]